MVNILCDDYRLRVLYMALNDSHSVIQTPAQQHEFFCQRKDIDILPSRSYLPGTSSY
jgi:hypothetical protein